MWKATVSPMKISPSLKIVNPDEMSLLGLMLGSILKDNLASAEGAERASKMNGRLGVTAGRMSLTIDFGGDAVSVERGLGEPLKAKVKGSLGSLLRVSLGQSPVMAFLAGEVSIKGNPLFALKAIPLFKAPQREGVNP
jgi:putative sterol carrier protein